MDIDIKVLRDAFEAAWSDFCSDTGCYPDFLNVDFEKKTIEADFDAFEIVLCAAITHHYERIKSQKNQLLCPYCGKSESGWEKEELQCGWRTNPKSGAKQYHCYAAYCN